MIKHKIINLKIEVHLHRQLRVAVAQFGTNTRKYVRNAIIEKLAKDGFITLKQPEESKPVEKAESF